MKKSRFQFVKPIIRNINLKQNGKWNSEDNYKFIPRILVKIFKNNENKINYKLSEIDEPVVVSVEIVLGEEDSDKYPFYLDIEVASEFEWDNIENIEPYLRVNAPSLLISYIRPTISLLTSQLGIPAYDLPLIDLSISKE